MKTKRFLLGCFLSLTLTLIGAEPPDTKKLRPEEVIALWSPGKLQHSEKVLEGGPLGPELSAYSFRIVGPSFEAMWNHYADLCGIKDRYMETRFLTGEESGPKGRSLVADREPSNADGMPGRGLTMFVLKTEDYTVTVTFLPSVDKRSIIGSITAVTRP